MDIAFVLYDKFTALDLIGPYEVLSSWPGARGHFVASTRQPISSDKGLIVTPTAHVDDLVAPDVVVVPGSSRPYGPLGDEVLLDWIRRVSRTATWLTSVCTGSALYATAGVLGSHPATTHWAFRDALASMGATVSTDRVVIDPPFVSGAGVSAGIDMALTLTALVHGEEVARRIQLGIEYDPQPPFDAGSPEKAGPEAVAAMVARLAATA